MKERSKLIFNPARIVFYVLSLAVFYLAIHYVGKLKDIKSLILEMNPFWLLLVLVSQIASYCIYAQILQTFLEKKQSKVSFLKLFQIAVVLLFVNQILPTGGISGNSYVYKQLVNRNVKRLDAFHILILELISYYISFYQEIS